MNNHPKSNRFQKRKLWSPKHLEKLPSLLDHVHSASSLRVDQFLGFNPFSIIKINSLIRGFGVLGLRLFCIVT